MKIEMDGSGGRVGRIEWAYDSVSNGARAYVQTLTNGTRMLELAVWRLQVSVRLS